MKQKQPIGKLTAFDWNFSKVQDWELITCCTYEYARESPSIIRCMEMPESSLNDSSHWLRTFIIWSEENHLLTRLEPAFHTGKCTFSEPWQAKAEHERRKACNKFLNETGVTIPVSADNDYQFCRSFDEETGVECIPLQIHWKTFTNDEIAAAFENLIASSRPPEFPEPRKRGHNLKEWRASLDRLGILRLRHFYSFDETIQLLPEGWDNASKYSDKKESTRECKRAVKDFRKYFGFLANSERLFCAKPKPG